MLIKQITKKGDAVPLTPQEALKHALQRALAFLSEPGKVYWLGAEVVSADELSVTQGEGDSYEAVASGSCYVGHTLTAEDKFFTAKPHSFRVHYRSSKDDIGVPDISIVSCNFEKAPANFSKGPDQNQEISSGEVQISGGKITSKYSKKL